MADYDEVVEGAVSADPLAFARELAAAIAEYSAGASVRGGAQPVAPAELARRKKAGEELEAFLAECEENGHTPRYLITTPAPGGFFIDDILIEGGQEIEFCGIPNQEMEPRNPPARQAHSLYMTSIGGGVDLGDQAYDAYANRPRHASIVGARHEPPPLGTPRAVSRARLVGDERQDDLPGVTPGQSILHPNGNGGRARDPMNGRYKPMPEP